MDPVRCAQRSTAVPSPYSSSTCQSLAGDSPYPRGLYVTAFGLTDFRNELAEVSVPTLVIHGEADAIVPFEVSGKRSHETLNNSSLTLIEGGPHGLNATHPE